MIYLKSCIILLLAGIVCLSLSGAPGDKKAVSQGEITAFYPVPKEYCGLFIPGETPAHILHINNPTGKTLSLTAKVRVTSLEGKITEEYQKEFTLPPRTSKAHTFRFKAPEKFGYYLTDAVVFSNGKETIRRQSAFALVPKIKGRRDPYFGMNHCRWSKVLPGLTRSGFGTLELRVFPHAYLTQYRWIYDKPYNMPRSREGYLNYFEIASPVDKALNNGFKVIGQIYFYPTHFPEHKKRAAANLFPATDQHLKNAASFGEILAKKYRNRIRLWTLVEEVDAGAMAPAPVSGTSLAQLTQYQLFCKNMASALKKIDPDTKIVIMPSMGFDWRLNNPKFLYSKLIMKDLENLFDYYGMDMYVNAGNALRGRLIPPEHNGDFRKAYLDAASFAESLNVPGLVFNLERGYGTFYRGNLLTPSSRQQADYTVRSLIIARATNVCPYYSLYTPLASLIDRERLNRLDPAKDYVDYGIWKGVMDEKRSADYIWIPRPAAAAVSIAARELAFVKNGRQFQFLNEINAALFDAPGKKQLLALWSTRQASGYDAEALLQLPGEGLLNDGWGNQKKVSGKLRLTLTETPQYLRLNASRKEVEKILLSGTFTSKAPVRCFGRRISSDTIQLQINNPQTTVKKAAVLLSGKNIPVTLKKGINFISVKCSKDITSALLKLDGSKIKFPVECEAVKVRKLAKKVVFDGGSWFKDASKILLIPQKHVFPETARMAEARYFKMDGTDQPVKLYYAWDARCFYIGADVPDAVHLQRRNNADIWMEDSFQIALSSRFDTVNALLMPNFSGNRFSSKERNFCLALCGNTPRLFEYGFRRGEKNYLRNVTRKNGHTVYELAIPWSETGITPGKGKGFSAGVVIFNNDKPERQRPTYWYVHGNGVAGGENVSKFMTFIME